MMSKKEAGIVGTFEESKQGNEEGVLLVDAVRLALARAMKENERVVLLGEDIGRNGGVFRATDGLLKEFGKDRVIDTPLAEGMIAGVAVGMALTGLLVPVAEFQFSGFMYPSLDQLECHASRMRNRTRGRLSCPLVFRAPYGAGIHAPEHHSESREAFWAHIPGLRVVIPSSPSKAYGLLLASIRNPDPVVFLEPKRIYRSFREPITDDGTELPLDTSFVLREGTDVTLVSWGAMMKETKAAARALARYGVEADVIDIATLGATCDMETVFSSVEKTGRCVIVHEAVKTGGFGAEIAARLAEEKIMCLRAPLRRVTAPDTVVPLSRMEHLFLPDVQQIVAAVHEVLRY